jgi:hemerythrin-like domain-containing protein
MANKRRTTELNQQIDDNLRRVYADAAKEPVPERFTKLLEQLRMHAAERPPEPPEEKS